MRLLVFFIAFAFVCVALASCHKDTGNTHPPLVETMTINGNPCVINCIYDDHNRVTSVTQCDTVETYAYYADSIVYVCTNSTGFVYKYIYAINNKGITTGYNKIANDGSVTNYVFTYDANNNRISMTDNTHPGTFVDYTIQNNNAVYDSSVSAVLNSGNYTVSRTYYANTDNRLSLVNYGKRFLGSSSANLKKTESYNTPDGQFVIHYTYELNYQNNVSRRIMKVNDSIIETRSYEYSGAH